MFGADEFSAIINPPESAILAIGAVRAAAMVKDGALYAGKALTLTLSCDHRVIDGVNAAQFLARLDVILTEPARFLGL
jgi:pyruvate dehydrogenase E2 component (dihydrolipoamide acetyltransferase)